MRNNDVWVFKLNDDGSCPPLDTDTSITPAVTTITPNDTNVTDVDTDVIDRDTFATESATYVIILQQAP